MSSVLGSVYRCAACGHEEMNPHGYPMCPQCASDWLPVSASALSPKAASSVIEAVSAQSSTSVAADLMATSASSSALTLPPFAVCVMQDPQHAEASRICLEVQLQNTTLQLLQGQVWLADRDGHEGPPETFELHATTPASPAAGQPVTVFPQIDRQMSSSSHIAVRIKPRNSRVAFWQGDLLVRRRADGSISVTIDKSVRAETSLGGIDESVVNIYAGQMTDGGWQSLPVRLRGPKDLAHADDVHRPASSRQDRQIASRDGDPTAPPRHVARLTLSRRLHCGREEYVHLLAGQTFHLGRAKTWDSRHHADFLPNDIVLRSLKTEESDDYISRYHGRIQILPDDVSYSNFSGNGTQVGNSSGVRTLTEKGSSLSLRSNTRLQPGRAVASHPNKSLGLLVRRTSSKFDAEAYELLARDWHLQSSVDPSRIGDTVTLNRTDTVGELEQYVLFPQSTLIGSSETLCGWHLSDSSVQSVHATLLWLDGSFWIEPFSHTCEVRVNDVLIPKNRVRRLTASASVKIGNLEFLVLPEWKQHIIDCRCCTGHK